MGNNTNPTYVFLKGSTYYFNRHIPKDVRSYYKSNRVIICLKTKRRFEALRAAKSACNYFSNVLTPYTNRLHYDHFHLDNGMLGKNDCHLFCSLYCILSDSHI